jgi:hypothetical protein
MDFLAFVFLVVLDLRHDFSGDVVLTVELEEPVREERVGADVRVLAIDAVDLERVEPDVKVDRVVMLEAERAVGSEQRELADGDRVVEDAGAGD